MKNLNKISKQLAITAIILVMGLSYANKASGQCNVDFVNSTSCWIPEWRIDYTDNTVIPPVSSHIDNTTYGALGPGITQIPINCVFDIDSVTIYDVGPTGADAVLICSTTQPCDDFFGGGACSPPPYPPYIVFLATWHSVYLVTID